MSKRPDNPIDREFELHIDLEVEVLMAQGMSEPDARREAMRRFGNRGRLRRDCEIVSTSGRSHSFATMLFESLASDLRQALRSFRQAPGFAFTAAATLALGIGATTTVFSVVDTLLLRPLPYPASDRLVQVGTVYPGRTQPSSVSPLNFFDWREQNDAFESLAASRLETQTVIRDGYPESILSAGVSAGFFELLGASAVQGRTILPEDDRPGAPRVAVLRYRAWQSRWGGDPDIVGRSVSLSGNPYTLVGVMPADFHPPEAIYHGDVDLWIPLAHVDDDLTQRDNGFLQVLGRLREGTSIEVASASLTALQQRVFEQEPADNERLAELRSQLRVGAVSLREQTVGDTGNTMWLFFGAVGLLLAIACANVANLFLARSADRGRELSLRAALGATRARIIRLLLVESLTLALIAGVAGVILAVLGVRAFLALAPPELPRLSEVTLDVRVLAFSACVSVLTGLVFGIAPAARQANRDAREALAEGAQSITAGRNRNRLRRAMVGIEVAVAAVLLIGAGLLANSLIRLTSVDPGFEPDGVVRMALYIGDNYEGGEMRAAFFTDVVERLRSAPGVLSAAATTDLPMTRNRSVSEVTVEIGSRTNSADVTVHRVTPGYFETLRIPVIAGRDFASADRGGEPIAIVSRAFAQSFWPDQETVGRRFKFGDAESDAEWIRIIAVTGDIHQHALGVESGPAVYLYHERSPFVFGNVMARGTGPSADLIALLRRELRALDNRQPIEEIGPLTNQMSLTVTRPRFTASLVGSFAVLAMIIAAVGIYGAITYIVRQRTHEVGIRMALGASGHAVVALLMRQGLTSVAIGGLAGLVVAMPLSRVLETFVYGIGTTDIPTYVSVALLLAIVSAAACWFPAQRAVRVDPARTLRTE